MYSGNLFERSKRVGFDTVFPAKFLFRNLPDGASLNARTTFTGVNSPSFKEL